MERQSRDRTSNTNRKEEWARGKDSALRDRMKQQKSANQSQYFLFSTFDNEILRRDVNISACFTKSSIFKKRRQVPSPEASLYFNRATLLGLVIFCFPFSNFVPFCRMTLASLCCVHGSHLRLASSLIMQNCSEMTDKKRWFCKQNKAKTMR